MLFFIQGVTSFDICKILQWILMHIFPSTYISLVVIPYPCNGDFERWPFFLQIILCFIFHKTRVRTSTVSSSKSFNIRCLSWVSLWLCSSSVTSNHQLLSSGFQHIWHGPWFPRWCSRHCKISNKQKTSCNSMWVRKLAPLTKTHEYFRQHKGQGTILFLESQA